jgi:adenylate cyclase class 2
MQETEAKFYVQDLNRIKSLLEKLGAQFIQERVLETNIRFDLPGAKLRAEGRVLRLRHDTDARLTYKSASIQEQGVLSREEIEFVVEDFEKARRFLEALGYQKLVYYEKYRTTYELNKTHIMLDELPYGDFIEIEGETVEAIRDVGNHLHLNWETAIGTSYSALFERARQALKLSFQDLSFANFEGIKVEANDLGVHAADAWMDWFHGFNKVT